MQHQQSASFKATEAQHTPKFSSMQGLSAHIGPTSGRSCHDIVVQVYVRLGEIRKSNFCRIGAATLQHRKSASFKASEAQHTPKCSSMQGLSGHIGLTYWR
jgi:hypothetical protein